MLFLLGRGWRDAQPRDRFHAHWHVFSIECQSSVEARHLLSALERESARRLVLKCSTYDHPSKQIHGIE